MLDLYKELKRVETKDYQDKYARLRDNKILPQTTALTQKLHRVQVLQSHYMAPAGSERKVTRLVKKVERTKKFELWANGWDRSWIKYNYDDTFKTLAKIDHAIALPDLDANPTVAFDQMVQKHLVPVLNNSDLVQGDRDRDYHDQAALVAVSQAHLPPKDNCVEDQSLQWVLNDRCFNDSTVEHFRYTIITPLADIPQNAINGDVRPNYFFTRGKFALSPRSWVLYKPGKEPENGWQEVWKKLQIANPNIRVVGIDPNVSRSQAVRAFISQLGYRLEDACTGGWVDKESTQQFNALAAQIGRFGAPTPNREPVREQ